MIALQRGASFLLMEMRMCSARQDGFNAEPERLNCMEVRGGHVQADYFFSRPGLDVWVASRPQRNTTQEGGEVHFLSSCASGRITRMLLADVGGFGTHFNDVARELRDMMKQSVNAISEKTVMRRLSGNLKYAAQHHGFASIVMGTFFAPTRSMRICNAGHPPPLLYRKSSDQWSALKSPAAPAAAWESSGGTLNLGELQNFRLKMQTGDMLFCYSNGLTEFPNAAGRTIGLTGLQELARELSQTQGPPHAIQAQLRRIVDQAGAHAEDLTLVLAKATGTRVSLRDDCLALLRLLRGVDDRTQLP